MTSSPTQAVITDPFNSARKAPQPGLNNIFTSTCARALLRASVGDKPKLERLIHSTIAPVGLARRARVLLASEGVAKYEIAALVGMGRPTVNRWRSRYATFGIAGLENRNGPAGPGSRTKPRSSPTR
jgi:hypothetical protein